MSATCTSSRQAAALAFQGGRVPLELVDRFGGPPLPLRVRGLAAVVESHPGIFAVAGEHSDAEARVWTVLEERGTIGEEEMERIEKLVEGLTRERRPAPGGDELASYPLARALLDRGVPNSRLTAAGRGEAEPIADNGTAQGRRENRRVEIYLVGGDVAGLNPATD